MVTSMPSLRQRLLPGDRELLVLVALQHDLEGERRAVRRRQRAVLQRVAGLLQLVEADSQECAVAAASRRRPAAVQPSVHDLGRHRVGEGRKQRLLRLARRAAERGQFGIVVEAPGARIGAGEQVAVRPFEIEQARSARRAASDPGTPAAACS